MRLFKFLLFIVALSLIDVTTVHATTDSQLSVCEEIFYPSEFASVLKKNGLSVGDLTQLKEIDPSAATIGFALPQISKTVESAPTPFFSVIALSMASIGFEADLMDDFIDLFAESDPLLSQLKEEDATLWTQTWKRFNAALPMVSDMEVPLILQELKEDGELYFAFVSLLSSLRSPSIIGFSENTKVDTLQLYQRFLKLRHSPSLTFGNLVDQSRLAQETFVDRFCDFYSLQKYREELLPLFRQYLTGEMVAVKPEWKSMYENIVRMYQFVKKQKDPQFMIMVLGRLISRMLGDARDAKNIPLPVTAPRVIKFASQFLDEDIFIDRGLKSHLLIPIVELYTGEGVPSAEQARILWKDAISERYKSLRRAVKAMKQSQATQPTPMHTTSVANLRGVPQVERVLGLPYKLREKKQEASPEVMVPLGIVDDTLTLESIRKDPVLLETIQPGQRIKVRFERTRQEVHVAFSNEVLSAFRGRGKGASPMTEPMQWLDALSLGPAGQGSEGIRKLVAEPYNGKYDVELKVRRWSDRIFGYVDGSGCIHLQTFGRLKRH